jgi:SulP family sulfate permease
MRFFQESFLPKSILCLKGYTVRKFLADLVAGITVGLVALPLAMAFAISSGLKPEAGIYTAVTAGFLISALGGSKTQIGGPTGAFVVVVAGIVERHGVDGLFTCTLMAGVLLIVFALTGLGAAIKYIPRTVVIGFTNGIAVLIASTQVKDFFGLHIDKMPGDFIGRLGAIIRHWDTLSRLPTLVSCVALLILIFFRSKIRRLPGSIFVLFAATAITWGLHLPLETIETRFGGIPSGLPHFAPPQIRFDLMLPLLSPAFTVAMLGAIESLLSAVVSDRMSGDRHKPNVELFAQGIANVVSPLFGGLPATGAIARTATNIRSGAQSPIAGMIHALTLAAVLAFAAPVARHIPLPVLAAILMMVSWNMGEWREIPEILKLSGADIAIWAITFALTVFADLTVAVEVGMILAALVYIRKVTATSTVIRVTPEYVQDGFAHSLQTNPIPDGIAVFRIHGPFLFGATDKLGVVEEQLSLLPPVLILRLRNMTAIDATGLHALENLAGKLHASNRSLVICGMRDQPARLISQAEFHRHLGDANIQPSFATALKRAQEILRNSDAVISR